MIIPQIARAGKGWLKGGTVNVGKYSTSAPLGDNGAEKFFYISTHVFAGIKDAHPAFEVRILGAAACRLVEMAGVCPRTDQQSTGLLVARCGAPSCSTPRPQDTNRPRPAGRRRSGVAWWRWRESNPRPKTRSRSFLRA